MKAIAHFIAGVFGLVTVASVLLGFNFMPTVLYTLNNLVGFILLLIFVTLLTGDK
jgi:hypothetical protein|tara:strand:+ start:260 stop:424 length:165 start_codon:yes stop_codon:yes gene_type:complete